ncbi:BTAD domain-containing putative transcriptional regulator [Streptomyces lydicus]
MVLFKLLGPFEASVAERPIRINSSRERTVLATLLLSCDRVVSVDSLTEAIWQGDPPATARNQIAIYITSLRRIFREASAPDGMIETSHPGYILHSENCYIDLKDLKQTVTRARLVAAHSTQAGEAVALFEHALSLWRGPALDGITGVHIDDVAGQLAEFRLDVSEEYAALQLGIGDRHLAGLQLAARPAEALQVYREGRKALVDELGIEPGPLLQEMHRQILQNDNGRAAFTEPPRPAREPEPGPALGRPAQLPLSLGTFTGRESEIEELDTALPPTADGASPAVAAISGASGVGKSALAVHWANRIADRFPDGQLFIDVHGSHESHRPLSSESILDQALCGLGVSGARIPAGLQERFALYRSLLNNRNLLIVLDDVRSFTQIQPLLPGHGQSLVLITSRDPLRELADDYGAVQVQLNAMAAHRDDQMLATAIGAERVTAEPETTSRLAELSGRIPDFLSSKPGQASRHTLRLRSASTSSDEGKRGLKEIGIGGDAERAYRALLKEPAAGAQAIAEQLGWPLHRAAGALDELFELSLAQTSLEQPGRARPVAPELGLRSLVQSQERELLKLQLSLSEGKLATENLIMEYRREAHTGDIENVELVSGPDAIQACIEKATQECHEEVVALLPGVAQPEDRLQAARPLARMLLERSVLMRCVYPHSIRNDRPTNEYAQWLSEQGGQVRTAPQLPPLMLIWDRRKALVPLDPDQPDRGAFLLSSPGPAAALHALFEQVWQQASRFGQERQPGRERDLSDEETAILSLLASGLTDEVTARKLGVSVRTSRRITAELMNKLGARSRFQLGALAAQGGWLTV